MANELSKAILKGRNNFRKAWKLTSHMQREKPEKVKDSYIEYT